MEKNLCKHCVHFVPPPKPFLFSKQNIKKGKCSLFAKISIIDGEIYFEKAEKARNELCKGEFFK